MITGDLKTCDFKCANFLYENDTCLDTCPSPYSQVIQGVEKYCKAPCDINSFYYQNGTCGSSCSSPFTQIVSGNLKYCNFPCTGTTFLNWQGTACQSTCTLPFQQLIQGYERYCLKPCGGSSYYYSNGTCLSNCNYPFEASGQGSWSQCNFKCSGSDFLYENDTCLGGCDAPYVQVIQGLERYCKKPCSSGAYLYENGTCKAGCDSPFVALSIGGVDYCNFECAGANSFYNWLDTCQSGCISPFIQVLQGVERYCQKPCQGDDYFYQNSTCLVGCESPFVEDEIGGYKACSFPCQNGQFLAWDNTCQAGCNQPFIQEVKGVEKYCNSPCMTSDYLYENVTCMASCAPNFFEVDVRSIKYCNFTCYDDGFMYWNETCQSVCEAPLVQVIKGVEKYCEAPCFEGEFRYENGTCSACCDAPYVKGNNGDFDTCEKPCSGNNEFLYWNGSCAEGCPVSFQQDVDSVKTCLFHCDGGFYHYWNDTCSSTCDAPLTVVYAQQGYEYCEQPCQEGKYLYQNGSCLAECNYQIIIDENGVSKCTYPCDTGEYLYQNATCKSNCPRPYGSLTTYDGLLLCNSPCDSDEYYRQELDSCVSHCSFPLTIRQEGILNICENLPNNGTNSNTTDPDTPSTENNNTIISLSEKLAQLGESFTALASAASDASSFLRPNDPNSAFMISAAKSTKHVKLLNLSLYQEETQRILEENDESSSSGFSLTGMFTYKMPKSLKNQFESQPLPEALQGKVFHTSFLVNLWESLTSFLSLIVLGVFFVACEFIAKKAKRPVLTTIMRKLRNLTEWNFLLSIFLNCYDDITLYTIIELTTLKLNTFPALVSFLVCLVTCSIGVYVLYKVIRITVDSLKINKQVADEKERAKTEDEFCKKYSNYQVVYVGYQNSSFLKQAFLLFFVGKIIVSYVIIGCLYNHPVVQTSLLTVLSLLMIFYLLKEKPTYDKFHLLVLVLFEIFGLIANICMVSLAVLVSKGSTNIPIQENLSKTILICSLANDLSASLVLWAYILMAIYAAIKKTKEPGVEAKTAWLNVLVTPYQLPGMELYEEEETMVTESDDPEKGLKPRRRRRIRPSRRRVHRKVGPVISLVNNTKQESEIGNILFHDETMVNHSKLSLKKKPSFPSNASGRGQNFIQMESYILGSDNEIQEHDTMAILSPFSVENSRAGGGSAGSSPESISSPSQRLLLKSFEATTSHSRQRKAGLTRPRGQQKPAIVALDKYIPSVIIEESSPVFKNTENDTPLCKRKPLEAMLRAVESSGPRENVLLRSRGLNRPMREQIAEDVVNLEDGKTEELVYKDEEEDNNTDGSLNTFSKMVRTWKQRNYEKEGGLRSTAASIVNDLGVSIDDEKLSREGSGSRRGGVERLVRSGKRSVTGNDKNCHTERDQGRQNPVRGGSGSYTQRGYDLIVNDIGSGDEMIIEDIKERPRSLANVFRRPRNPQS